MNLWHANYHCSTGVLTFHVDIRPCVKCELAYGIVALYWQNSNGHHLLKFHYYMKSTFFALNYFLTNSTVVVDKTQAELTVQRNSC